MSERPDDLLARLTGLHELRLRVRPNIALGTVELEVLGLPGDYSVDIAPRHAIELVVRITETVARLNQSAQGWVVSQFELPQRVENGDRSSSRKAVAAGLLHVRLQSR
jgi:hypothetical protein